MCRDPHTAVFSGQLSHHLPPPLQKSAQWEAVTPASRGASRVLEGGRGHMQEANQPGRRLDLPGGPGSAGVHGVVQELQGLGWGQGRPWRVSAVHLRPWSLVPSPVCHGCQQQLHASRGCVRVSRGHSAHGKSVGAVCRSLCILPMESGLAEYLGARWG